MDQEYHATVNLTNEDIQSLNNKKKINNKLIFKLLTDQINKPLNNISR
jgi:hypothetical protein